MSRFFSRIRRGLLELNLFKSGVNEVEVVQKERYSTRLYLILLIISLVVLLMYIGFGIQTVHVTVQNPSLNTFERLLSKYPVTLKCPCSQVAVKYERFIQFKPTYHQICSSDFVTQEWISASYAANISNIWPMDVRTVISAHAQLLRSFCTNAQRTISYALSNILSSSIVNTEVLSPDRVKLQVDIQAGTFQSTSKSQMTVSISTLQLITSSNHLMSGLGTNSFVYMVSNESSTANANINAYQANSNSSPCYCLTLDKCAMPAARYSRQQLPTFGFYNLENFANGSIPVKGIQTGCFPMDGLFASTLECYYNSSCIELLVPNSQSFSPLSSTLSTNFPSNLTIEQIINGIMVEDWSINMSFLAYYNECAPKTCTYSFDQRNDFLVIFTTILALIGGLNTVLRLFVPLIIQLIAYIKQRIRSRNVVAQGTIVAWEETHSRSSPVKEKLVLLWQKIRMLNLFNSNSNNALKQRHERYTTRLYILFVIIAFIVLLSYAIAIKEPKVYTIRKPSQQVYDKIYAEHSDTIECTCNNIAITYSKFIQIQANYHQICSSSFISSDFFAQFAIIRSDTPYYDGDFILRSVEHFQWLFTFCVLAQQTIYEQFLAFEAGVFVNDKLLPRDVFDVQTTQLASDFISNALYLFARGIEELRQMMGFAQPISATSMLAYKLKITPTPYGSQVRIQPIDFFSGCCCICTPTACSNDAAFYTYNSMNNLFDLTFKIPGIRIACSPMESLLQSNLACWYSSDCYQTVIEYWRNRTYYFSIIPPILNNTIPSRFNSNTTLYMMIEELMVENWTKNISYNSYFNECAPLYCTYSVNERGDIVYLVTLLFGLFGGLNVALRLITPLFFRWAYWLMSHRRRCCNSFRRHLSELPSRLVQLNLFYDQSQSSELTVQRERHSTRFYLTSLITSMLILILYYSLSQLTVSITIDNPTEQIYENLRQSNNIYSLECACTQVSVSYKNFVQVNTTLHEICQSPFIEQPWIASIYGTGDWSNISLNDFHGNGVVYFQGLYSFCFMYRQNMVRYSANFLSSSFISAQVITKDELVSEVNDSIQLIQGTSRTDHSGLYKCARDLINDNQLLSIYSTNWVYSPIKYDPNLIGLPIPLKPVSLGNCSCATSATCSGPVQYNGELIPGFVVSCIPMQTLFQSTLICLYNQTCIDQININNLSVKPLIARSNTQLSINRTIEQLLDTAFDEQWSVNINYSKFFEECQPATCVYSSKRRREIVQIIITLLGLYGGLTVALGTIVPYIIVLIYKIIRQCRLCKNNSHSQDQNMLN